MKITYKSTLPVECPIFVLSINRYQANLSLFREYSHQFANLYKKRFLFQNIPLKNNVNLKEELFASICYDLPQKNNALI
jgi:hypothetical protein